MKVCFFQPYLAAWRLEFLERFVAETSYNVLVYDGGHRSKVDSKSVTGNTTSLSPVVLSSSSRSLNVRGNNYPIYFSPGLFASLVKERPDVVVTEGEINLLNNISIFLYSKLFGKKYIWWSLGKVRTRRTTWVSRVAKPLMGLLIRGSHKVIARNTYAKKYYTSSWAMPDTEVIVAPNSMDEERALREVDGELSGRLAHMKGHSRVILYVGALTEAKRPHELVRVVHRINQERFGETRALLWLVGEGPMRSSIEAAVEELGLQETVTLFGRVTAGVGSFFENADVAVVPGLGGLVINHAMIFGCPVVSGVADGTELDLVVDDETGVLVKSQDIESLKGAVERVIYHPDPQRLRRNCRDLIEKKWNMKLMIRQFERAIEGAESRK